MRLEYLNWNITSESGRPLIIDKDDTEKETRRLCLCKLTNTEEDLKKLCHVTEFESVEHQLGSNIRILCYDAESDVWIDEADNEVSNYEGVYAWYPLQNICSCLDGYPEPLLCWEFGWYIAKRSIPALGKWTKNGVSYPAGMEPERWKDVLTQIKTAFEVALADLDGGLDDIKDLEERERVIEEHKQMRK